MKKESDEENSEIVNIYNSISSFDKTKLENLSFYVLVRDKNKKYDVCLANLNSDARNVIFENLKEQLYNYSYTINIPFSPTNKTIKGHIECINQVDVDNLDNILNKFDGENAEDLKTFDYDNQSYEAWAFIVSIALNETNENGFTKKIVSFQKARTSELFKNKNLLGFIREEGSYSNFDNNKNMLTVGKTMDCILNDGKVYIFNHYNFELIFKFLQKYENFILKTLKNVKLEEDIIDYTKLFNIIESNTPYLKKLYNAITEEKLSLITSERILFLREKGYVHIPVENGEVVMNNQEDVKKIIKVLEQDYLKDPILDEKFETTPSGGKTKI